MVVVFSCEVLVSISLTLAHVTTAPVGSVTVPVTAEVADVAWPKHTTGKRSRMALRISDDVNFVML